MLTFQQLILKLNAFWDRQGCALLQPYDMEVGAGTFHTATFLRAIGPEPWKAAYVQPSRRPKDGRYGENPNRLQHYYQYQVVLKPSPPDIQELYLKSLAAMIVQSERFGTSLAQALKVYADALRTRRRLRAEAAVGKAGIKMLFPIVIFILPVLFVITLVPGMLSVFANLKLLGGGR